ncbi:MAG: hypothetical protein WCC04_00410 [Terriglobales bacterium]
MDDIDDELNDCVGEVNTENLSPKETERVAEHLLSHDPDDDGYDAARRVFIPEHPRWRTLIERSGVTFGPIKHRSKLEERKLVSVISEEDLKALKLRYIPVSDLDKYVREELTESTIAWSRNNTVMLVYLKDYIRLAMRNDAQKGLDRMVFPDPTRAETEGASDFNARLEPAAARAGELLFGFMDWGHIRMANPSREQEAQYSELKPLLRKLNTLFARVLPAQFAEQNRDIPTDFRQFGTAFSTTTILKSAPASVHKDSGNGLSLTCMTTVGQESSGGEFCLLEYGLRIPVRPGDVLIAATCREWHVNLTPVRGTKYSIICYFRRGLTSPARLDEWYQRDRKGEGI